MQVIQEFTVSPEPFINYDQAQIKRKELAAFNLFWAGFIVYTSAFVLFTALPYYLILNKLQLVGLFLIAIGTFSLIQFRIGNKYLRILYIFYCGWSIYTLSRGLKFDRVSLFSAVFDAWFGILPYFVPIVLLFPKNIYYLKKVFTTIIILGIVFVIYSVQYRGQLLTFGEDVTSQTIMEFFSKTLAIPCGFLIITYIYHSKTRRIIAFSIVLFTLLLAVIRGRRAITMMNVSYLMIFYITYLYVNKVKFITVMLSLFLVAIIGFAGFKFYSANKKGAFSLITGRIDEDTRSAVEICFYDDMKTKDWIIGRGLMGQYYCPGVDEASAENNFTDYRNMIETDYLNIILKGGIISLGLLLLITIPAMIKGVFFSKNILSKAAGAWILLWVLDLYPATVYTFTLNYVLVWISVGICYSRTIRSMPDSTIKEIFSGRG